MATQSPFSFLSGLVERAAQAVQPPTWFIHETQQRTVLFLNHVLMQEQEAMQRLVQHKGRVARVQWRHFNLALVVTPAGLLNVAAEGAKPDLQLEITESNPLALAQAAFSGNKPSLHIEGDVHLAGDIHWLIDNVQWDVEEDMARIMGDVPAHTLANLGRTVAGAVRQFVGSRTSGSSLDRLQP